MLQSSANDEAQSAYQSELFVQSALDALSAHIAILDDRGKIIGVNTAWCQFADENGLKDAEYSIGDNYLDVCDSAMGYNRDAAQASQGIREVLQRKSDQFQLEYPCHSKAEKRWFVMQVTRFDWRGQSRVIIAHQNVTELKKVQIELAESHKRTQAILDNVINGIITLDGHGRIEMMNPAALNIFGYTSEEIFEQSVNILFAPPQCELTTKALLEHLQSSIDHEMVGQRHDGTLFPLYIAISRVYIGHRRLYTAIIQDITDRKQMEAEILEKERLRIELDKEREVRELKNRFINMMSHELRTPLSSILLSSDLLKLYGDKAPPEEKRMYVDNISLQVEYLTELIRDVQTISRTGEQNTTFFPERIDLTEYCRTIVQEFNLSDNGERVIFHNDSYPIETDIDRKLMRQVLNNLIGNALKYSPDGGVVHVSLHNGGRFIHLDVRDEGIGIPPEDMPHLFEPFHRASNVDNLPGTGLGLVIAKQAIELHHGTLEVESVLNKGTTFKILLPVIID